MSIDDRNILSRLRRMGDRELTQYGQLNQDNPYLFPLVFQESQDRKEIRAGSLASNSRGNMPSVKEQALTTMAQPAASPQNAPTPSQVQPQDTETQMAADGGYMDSRLPEDMGIGALPERSLSNMADGGIVGFAAGGPKGKKLPSFNDALNIEGITDTHKARCFNR